MMDALWQLICAGGGAAHLADMLIFVPSRRAVRAIEKMLVDKMGHAIILPRLVPLGEGSDDPADMDDDDIPTDVISNQERVIVLSKLLSADAHIRTISNALPIARDLVRMTDYLENEGIDVASVDWDALVGDRFAAHFQSKADLLNILGRFAGDIAGHRPTQTQRRNADIRAWTRHMDDKYFRVIVCGSTASVPATSDLMVHTAQLPNGYILLPGKIDGATHEFELDTHPYNAEYKFLNRIGVSPDAVHAIDVGASDIDFWNAAFSNGGANAVGAQNCHLVECARESEEAAAAAEIAARSVAAGKSVLLITPDAAGNQRLAAALRARAIDADFSGGVSGAATAAGRAILNLFDDWIERGGDDFDRARIAASGDLFAMLVQLIDGRPELFAPGFCADDDTFASLWPALQILSDCLKSNQIDITVHDARALIADALSGVAVRPAMNDGASVVVLGTIESRMQTADVVILTGLNEGMFPARGYENAWLPRPIAAQIGLPSPDRKVSLMALDFMNLSCGPDVYWLRSRTAGGAQTAESRFLSRAAVAMRGAIAIAPDILDAVRAADNVPFEPLDYAAPRVPADRSDVYVTELELLIHNPYAFYARHILRLYPMDDYWVAPDARQFGNLVHGVIEDATDFTPATLVAEMDRRALALLGADTIVFHFWHRRFLEIAPVVATALGGAADAHAEIRGFVRIAGRTVRAQADRIWDGCVMDIKTGAAPSKKQLLDGTMPQLPLEALMMQSGGFPIATTIKSQTPVMQFLQLRNRDVRVIEYSGDEARAMIDAARDRVTQLFGMYSNDWQPYEYHETGDKKYQAWDDLARCGD